METEILSYDEERLEKGTIAGDSIGSQEIEC